MREVIFTCAVFLVSLGFYCLLAKRNLIKMIIGFNILESGIILLLVTTGYLEGGKPPVVREGVTVLYVDPLPQALALTAIVIGAGVTALGLSLIIKLYEAYKTLDSAKTARRASE